MEQRSLAMDERSPDQRPAGLQRLAIASFINQGVVFLVYSFGLFMALFMRTMDVEELVDMMRTQYEGLVGEQDLDQVEAYTRVLHEHGLALMGVFLLRTLARFAGVLRMWHRHPDGFHIYTSAQLLGILLPMLIGGNLFFSVFGLVAAVLWCMMYHQQRAWWRTGMAA